MNLVLPAIPFRRAQLFQGKPNELRPYIVGIWVVSDHIFATNGTGLYVCPLDTGVRTPRLLHLSKPLPSRLKPEDELMILHDDGDDTGLLLLGRLDLSAAVDIYEDLEPPNIHTIIPTAFGPLSRIGITPSILADMAMAWPKDTVLELLFQDPGQAFKAVPHPSDWSDYAVFMPAVITHE